MPEWEGVLDALLSCDPGHADLLETLIRNLRPIESVYAFVFIVIHGSTVYANKQTT